MRNKSLYTVIAAILMTLFANAETREILVSKLQGDLTSNLRNIFEELNRSDNVIVNFDKPGKYTIKGTIECKSNIEIKGTGKKKVTIILDKGTDSKDFKAFTDDTFITCAGTKKRPISVSIHDISINLNTHKGIWWEQWAVFGIKIYHAKNVDIQNVDSYADNAIFTNIDMRVCSNITVKNCNITNYNNSFAGGNLWIRGETSNVTISDNTFRKYGNDEMFAFFEATAEAHSNRRAHVKRENILISNNKFIYGSDRGCNDNMINDVLISFNTVGDDIAVNGFGCLNENIEFSDNLFEINAPCRRTLNIGFSEEDTQENVIFKGNVLENNFTETDKRYYHQDIVIKDKSADRKNVYFINNTFSNHMPVVNNYGTTGNSIALLRGGHILLEDNYISDDAPNSPLTKETLGTTLIWSGEQGGSATLISNEVIGMKLLATISEGAGIDQFSINATDNDFEGDTRIYCNNVALLDLSFIGNVFKSSNMNFFLQEFAKEGTLGLKNNKGYATNGQLMTHWSGTSTSAMRFNTLDVTGNTFYGTNGEKNVFANITNVRKKNVKGNIYYSK
ncbi:MAG: hypothetical protein MJZ63_01155 [Muribaculaceae bacterium]|nr:hypothetical protein [Muribaculaceae bacterium]